MPDKLKARAARKTAKREEKKRLIAESAIEALKELGYANTSLRDIAERSDLSLGMLHYYFDDRSELIIFCVEVYKRQFVADITAALDKAEGREGVIDAFAKALAESIVSDAPTHCLWYDIRNQALFDATFQPVVKDVEAMLIDMVRGALVKSGHESLETVDLSYSLLDGLFRYLMQRQITDGTQTIDELTEIFRSLLDQFI